MFIYGGIVGVFLLFFWVWAILDVIATEESLIRNLPKGMWLILVIFLSSIGALAWVLLGRPEGAGIRPGDTSPRPVRRTLGPEDNPRWHPRLDSRAGIHETERERIDRERRERYAAFDAELDRRIDERLSGKQAELEAWEEDLRRRERELGPGAGEGNPA